MIRVKINISSAEGAFDYPLSAGAFHGKMIPPRCLIWDDPIFSSENLLFETHLQDLLAEDVLFFLDRPVEQEIQQVYS